MSKTDEDEDSLSRAMKRLREGVETCDPVDSQNSVYFAFLSESCAVAASVEDNGSVWLSVCDDDGGDEPSVWVLNANAVVALRDACNMAIGRFAKKAPQ